MSSNDFSRMTTPELTRRRRSLEREFQRVRKVFPPDIARLEEIVAETKAVATEQIKRANQQQPTGRIRGFRPPWAGKKKDDLSQ
ncbi:MAG TPA: hypothetical protein VI193_05510 [Acidimicrobiia bacterium]